MVVGTAYNGQKTYMFNCRFDAGGSFIGLARVRRSLFGRMKWRGAPTRVVVVTLSLPGSALAAEGGSV